MTGLKASFVMMSVFSLYIGYMTFFDPDHSCSCGGVLESMSWIGHLIFNIVLTLATGIGLWLSNKDIIAISRESRKPV
ncbi:MAG: hypothetical protein JST09_18905 [Bacteroidetes bacterium]|nr:hypothetical protein [Bacteroidota bacterium]MBS1747574.1 hypothetical protein [Bacteroidota bacterium]